jgi:hypothetical protein
MRTSQLLMSQGRISDRRSDTLRGDASPLEAPPMQFSATKIITRKTTRFGGAAGMRAI